jgi:cytoskeletal protein CcmA (bactofilin family)
MRHSMKSVYTLIGAGMRIEGNVACTGVLRVQGDILGNVSCGDDQAGSVIVDSAGSVTGAVKATHVDVKGRIVGPVNSQHTVEIHPGASLTGDVSFRQLAIHAGGIVDGRLDPVAAPDEEAAAEPPSKAAEKAARAMPPAMADQAAEPVTVRKIGIAAVGVLAIGAAVWVGTHPGLFSRPAADLPLKTDTALNVPADPLPAAPVQVAPAAETPQEPAKAAEADTAPPPPAAIAAAGSPAVAAPEVPEATPAEPAAKSQDRIVAVKGTNPNRPPGVFLLISGGSAVLYRKTRDTPGDGDRIAIPAGEKASVAFAPNELIRVAQGSDVTILYQGKKVSRDIVHSGAWISFVPR